MQASADQRVSCASAPGSGPPELRRKTAASFVAVKGFRSLLLVLGAFAVLTGALDLHAQVAGSVDSGFNPNASNGVYSTAGQLDAKLILGGAFTTVGEVPRNLSRGSMPTARWTRASIPMRTVTFAASRCRRTARSLSSATLPRLAGWRAFALRDSMPTVHWNGLKSQCTRRPRLHYCDTGRWEDRHRG